MRRNYYFNDNIHVICVSRKESSIRERFNDYYCKDISKKIRSSLKIKKIEGKFTGWKAPYGYIRNKEDYHKLEIDKKVYKNIKLIFNLACNDYNPYEEWIIIENTHKAIIDKDTFYKVQNKIKNNSKRINKDNIKELIYCKECNTKIGINKRKNKLYLVCNTYKKFSKEKRCTPHTFNYLKIKKFSTKLTYLLITFF